MIAGYTGPNDLRINDLGRQSGRPLRNQDQRELGAWRVLDTRGSVSADQRPSRQLDQYTRFMF